MTHLTLKEFIKIKIKRELCVFYQSFFIKKIWRKILHLKVLNVLFKDANFKNAACKHLKQLITLFYVIGEDGG